MVVRFKNDIRSGMQYTKRKHFGSQYFRTFETSKSVRIFYCLKYLIDSNFFSEEKDKKAFLISNVLLTKCCHFSAKSTLKIILIFLNNDN